MNDFLTNPQNWFIAAAVVGIGGIGYLAYEIVSFHYRYKGYEPAVDLDQLQREMDEEFGNGTGTEAGVLRTL